MIGFFTGTWSLGYVALLGAAVLLATKTVEWKKAFKDVDWNTVCVLGFATAMAAGMNDSGAGLMVSEFFLKHCVRYF
jgi:di/tricarboxylate transporter